MKVKDVIKLIDSGRGEKLREQLEDGEWYHIAPNKLSSLKEELLKHDPEQDTNIAVAV